MGANLAPPAVFSYFRHGFRSESEDVKANRDKVHLGLTTPNNNMYMCYCSSYLVLGWRCDTGSNPGVVVDD